MDEHKLNDGDKAAYDAAQATQRRLGLYAVQRKLKSGWWTTSCKLIRGHDAAYEEMKKRKKKSPNAEWCVVSLPVAQAREECYKLHRQGGSK